MTNSIPLILVDGGGSGSRLRAVGTDGATLAEATCGPSNLTYGVAPAWRNLERGVEDIARETGMSAKGVRLWCGLAGGRSPKKQAEFRTADPIGTDEITIVTDGFASLIGAHGGQPGTVLAVGTGVAAFSLGEDGVVRSSSAWGYKIGDEGSGGWIGTRAVGLLARHMDGRTLHSSTLFDALKHRVGADFNTIQTWLSQADATRFAALAPLVVEAAKMNDGVATGLLKAAADELAIAIRAVDKGHPIALLGGLGPVMAPRLPQDLRDRIIPPRGTALDGLQTMAQRGWRDEDRVATGGAM